MKPKKSELECISIANEHKRQSLEVLLQVKLEDHRKTRSDFTRTCREVFSSGSVKRILLLALLLPFFALLQLVLVLLDYIGLVMEGRRIRREMQSFDSQAFDAPEQKTISALWAACELKDWYPELTYAAKIDCVRRWLPALYGPSIAQVICIDLREEEVRELRREARLKHPPQPGVFVTERDPAEMLVEILSNEMPPYN